MVLFINYTLRLYTGVRVIKRSWFSSIEVIRSATLYGAQALGADKEIGSVEPESWPT
jgi:imidazolonepropionase-like amidohydrolase